MSCSNEKNDEVIIIIWLLYYHYNKCALAKVNSETHVDLCGFADIIIVFKLNLYKNI